MRGQRLYIYIYIYIYISILLVYSLVDFHPKKLQAPKGIGMYVLAN